MTEITAHEQNNTSAEEEITDNIEIKQETIDYLNQAVKTLIPPVPTPEEMNKFLASIITEKKLHLSASVNDGALVLVIMPGIDEKGERTPDFNKLDPGLLLSRIIGVLMYMMNYNVSTGLFDLFTNTAKESYKPEETQKDE